MRKVICILLTIFLYSCVQSPENIFNKILQTAKIEPNLNRAVLYSIDLNGSSGNKFYDQLAKSGSKSNAYLLSLIENENPTEYCILNITGLLYDGDIAIKLLLDINNITDEDFNNFLIHPSIKDNYNSAADWYTWLHESQIHRLWVKDRICEILQNNR